MYKLLGPVMIAQDLTEAKVNVEKRLEFIQLEVYPALDCHSVDEMMTDRDNGARNRKRAERQISEIENKQAKKKADIQKMQKDYQHMMRAVEEAAKQHGGQ